MCQLLGISSKEPVRLGFGWQAFARRGSEQAGNPDGWGIAYRHDGDVLLLREPRPAIDSPLVRFLERNGPPSQCVISHVRRATHGQINLQNTQPFVRYLGGCAHVFAHNGHVAGTDALSMSHEKPVGETDSEQLFLTLLRKIGPLWNRGSVPALKSRLEVVTDIAGLARSAGAANFIYSDGHTMFAHAHRHTVPGEEISTDPGLYLLECDSPKNANHQVCSGIACDGRGGTMTIIATIPLDKQKWIPMNPGEIACIEQGRRVE